MKIVHFYRDIKGPSGVPYEVRELAAHQRSLGNSVVSVFRGREADADGDVAEIGLDGHISDLPRLRNFLHDFQPDIAHVTGLWIPCHNLWIRELWRANVPYVCEPHGMLNPIVENVRFGGRGHKKLWAVAKRVYRHVFDDSLMSRASGTRVLSDYEGELANGLGLKRPFLVPSAVDPGWFPPSSSVNKTKSGAIRLFYIGRLDPFQKGFDLLLDAFEILKGKGLLDQFEVLFVGPPVGDSMQWLKGEAERRGLRNVTVSGGVYGDAKHDLFNDSDLFLHPSRFEGFAKTAREAAAHGLPVLSSVEGNFGNWVASEEMGLVVQLDAADIARKIEVILGPDGRKHLDEMGRRARQFAERMSWQSVATEVIERYHEILNENSSR
jgi:glycosyltransferase involved in cell wall biosynthesis